MVVCFIAYLNRAHSDGNNDTWPVTMAEEICVACVACSSLLTLLSLNAIMQNKILMERLNDSLNCQY